MADAERSAVRSGLRPFGHAVAAVAVGVGLMLAPVHGVAWAVPDSESTSGESADGGGAASGGAATGPAASPSSAPGRVHDGPADRGKPKPKLGSGRPDVDHGAGTDADADDVGTKPGRRSVTTKPTGTADPEPAKVSTGGPEADPDANDDADDAKATNGTVTGLGPEEAVVPDIAVPETVSVVGKEPADGAVPTVVKPDRFERIVTVPVAETARATREESSVAPEPVSTSLTVDAPSVQGEEPNAALAVVAAARSTAVEITTPSPPEPLSPIAQLLELPGRLVNAVLEVFDFTSYADSPRLPIGLGPINDLIFGAFRELERLVGLWQTLPAQPVVPTLTYSCPTPECSTARPTPTVAQFLNASTAGYVLGSTPGGLVPFTVDGFQVSETNVLTGMVGKAWVTPEGQIIIAYQGTTGGTHLLFNPLITIAQVVADLQVVFTGTTPLAFYDALDFAERVRAEAALQGYEDDDIFVTGHSLGGWEAQYVAQQTGLAGIGFEAPGMNTTVPGNGADSMFVNIGTYGSSAPYMSTDLPGLQPFMPPYVPGGGSKPHYGPIVMIGDPAAMTPLYNASALWGKSLIGSAVFLVDYLMNFFQYHLPGVQAYHLDVVPDPGVVPFLGTSRGPVHEGYGELTIPQLLQAASNDGILFQP